MGKHAYLSASASHRWLACPPSAKLCAQEDDHGSPYAQQGTDAHELCQFLLEQALGRPCRDPTEDLTWYNAEMLEAAEGYRDFVLEQIGEAKKLCRDPLVCVEQTLDFSKWVEHGFGTGDCVIVADDLLHIVDFKFGLGVLVEATDNSQLKCYALGAVDTFGDLYDIRRIKLSIYQPRRENAGSIRNQRHSNSAAGFLNAGSAQIKRSGKKHRFTCSADHTADPNCTAIRSQSIHHRLDFSQRRRTRQWSKQQNTGRLLRQIRHLHNRLTESFNRSHCP